jgi:hypothetical protein
VSLDRVMEDPGGAESYDHGGWTFTFDSGEAGGWFKFSELMAADRSAARARHLRGLRQGVADDGSTGEFGEKFNSMPKFVVSKTLTSADWENSTILDGDLAEEVAELKGRFDNILVSGSARLAQDCSPHLVDELRLTVFPVVLGEGKRLFADGRAAAVRDCRVAVRRGRAADAAPEAPLALDRFEPQRAGKTRGGTVERVVESAADPRLGREALDLEDPAAAVGLQIGAARKAVAEEEREHVVPVGPLVLALVHLDQVVEAEQAPQERPVPHQVVERAQENRRGGGTVDRGAGGDEHRRAAVLDGDALERAFVDERVDVRPDGPGAAGGGSARRSRPRSARRAPRTARSVAALELVLSVRRAPRACFRITRSGKVMNALEPLPACDRYLTGGEQVLRAPFAGFQPHIGPMRPSKARTGSPPSARSRSSTSRSTARPSPVRSRPHQWWFASSCIRRLKRG